MKAEIVDKTPLLFLANDQLLGNRVHRGNIKVAKQWAVRSVVTCRQIPFYLGHNLLRTVPLKADILRLNVFEMGEYDLGVVRGSQHLLLR